MGGGWLCLTGLTSLQICVLPPLVCKGPASPFRSPVTSRCRSEETQGTDQCLDFLMLEYFSALLPLGIHELKQLRNWVCLSGAIKEHSHPPCCCQLWKILLLWHKGPRYPGAQSQVPSSGEQDPPFSQLQEMEQLGPQRPWLQMLSQWMPKDTKPHVRLLTTFTLLTDQRNAWLDWCLTVPQSQRGSLRRKQLLFHLLNKVKIRKMPARWILQVLVGACSVLSTIKETLHVIQEMKVRNCFKVTK